MTKMGRLIASVTVENLLDPSKNLRCDALVDTGASHMVLPRAWRERLGDLQTFRTVDVERLPHKQSCRVSFAGP